jgi:hypothetical protein
MARNQHSAVEKFRVKVRGVVLERKLENCIRFAVSAEQFKDQREFNCEGKGIWRCVEASAQHLGGIVEPGSICIRDSEVEALQR